MNEEKILEILNSEVYDNLYAKLMAQLREDLILMMEKLFRLPLTVEQTADILGTTSNAIYKRIYRGQLNASVIDGHQTITFEEILEKYRTVRNKRGRKANE